MKWRLPWLKANSRASAVDVTPHEQHFGVGHDWAPTEYAQYYASSVPVYSAVQVRADSLARVPWRVYRGFADGTKREIEPLHPLRTLLDRPNPWMTASELRRATETYLLLWGRAFWTIEEGEEGARELWPVRPDRMTILPGTGPRSNYIRGYLYTGEDGKEVAYLPDEVVPFTLFNPLKERTGLSPIAPSRLSIEMGLDALRYNRNTFKYASVPDFLLMAEPTLTEAEVEAFYKRWETRYSGPVGMRRPAIASSIRGVEKLAFSQRDMEFLESLYWSVGDAARVFRVPETMLGLLRYATLANTDLFERAFWRNTVMPQAHLYQDRINNFLLPQLGYPLHQVEFDFSVIEVLGEPEDARLRREVAYLQEGVLTINEVRTSRQLEEVPWGNQPKPQAKPAAPTNGHDPKANLTSPLMVSLSNHAEVNHRN
jgi:HK97 family phage portal protein